MSKFLDLIPNEASIIFIGNIQNSIHSSDLRDFFDDEIEANQFIIFHFRHRKYTDEILKNFPPNEISPSTNIDFLIIKNEYASNFVQKYNQNNLKNQKLFLNNITDYFLGLSIENKKKFLEQPEFNCPSYIPQGNVGTPLSVILDGISQCKIPSALLKSLRLKRPVKFKCIGFDYRGLGENLGEDFVKDLVNDGPDCEDWERHIQLHNDVDSQARTNERPYETEKEIVWEKGSSGLVHYTDVLYWNEKAGKNVFDEDTVDDWDVDMAVYTDENAADRDAIELLEMRKIELARKGKDPGLPVSKNLEKSNPKPMSLVDFEKYTKGFGSKQLEKYGWRAGSPIGKAGITEPIVCDFRKPQNKSGLGFISKRVVKPKIKKNDQELAKISTIYDEKDEKDDTAYESADPTFMKFREKRKK